MKCRTTYHRICRNCGKEFTTNISTIYCCSECRKAFSETNRNLSYTISTREAKLNMERARLSSKDYLSITQAAKLLGVSRPTIYKHISLGDIQVIRLSPRSIRIRRSDILPEPPKPVQVSPNAIRNTSSSAGTPPMATAASAMPAAASSPVPSTATAGSAASRKTTFARKTAAALS